MTLVLEPQLDGPATHALIMGVGAYKYMEGGEEPRSEITLGLKQLSSPPISAVALADWMIQKLDNPGAPLDSVDLLLSPEQEYVALEGQTTHVECATIENIKTAFKGWRERCNSHPENIALFYFCGHGLEKDTLVLLPADFGAQEDNRWNDAIDFQATYRGMKGVGASTQLYFLDCCRQLTTEILEDEGFGGISLRSGNYRTRSNRVAPQLLATGKNLRAFGKDGEVSRFTSALLEALRGQAARMEAGRWVISTLKLGDTVYRLLKRANQLLDPPDRQVAHSQGEIGGDARVLHVLGGPPDVKTTVVCTPEEANRRALLYITRRGVRFERPPASGPWSQNVPAGVYDVGASFVKKTHRDCTHHDEFMEPPDHPVDLEIS